jgi:WD40 repeat protein
MSSINKNTVALCVALSLALLCGRVGRADEKAPDLDKDTPKTAAPFKVVRALKARRGVYALSFSPDGRLLAAGADRALQVWEPATGKLVREVAREGGPVALAVFVDGGRAVACRAPDDTLQVIHTRSGEVRATLEPTEHGLQEMAPSPDGKLLACVASGVGGHVILWDLSSGKRKWRIQLDEEFSWPNSVAVTPDGKAVAVSTDNAVRLYDIASGKELRQLLARDTESACGRLQVAPNGKILAVAAHNVIRLLDVSTAKVTHELRWRPRQPPEVKEVGPDGRKQHFAFGGAWDMAFSPDGKVLAVGCCDHKVRLWEVASGRLRHQAAHKAVSLTFSRDGLLLALGSAKDHDISLCNWLDPGLEPSRLTGERVDQLWGDLAAKDAAVAYRAMAELAASPQQAIPLLAKRLRRGPSVSPAQLNRLVADLDSGNFEVRKRAFRQLAALERVAEPALRDALTRRPTLELRKRINELLDQLSQLGPDQWRQLRLIELMEYLRTPEARGVLRQIADGSAGKALATEDAKAALGRLARAQLSGP